MKRMISLAMAMIFVMFAATVSFAEAVKVEKKEGVGTYLTDTSGMTLYYFKKDSPGKSVCVGECAVRWPIYSNEAVAVPEGVNAADFGVIAREDGKKQSTYKGMPLYYFFKDKAAGDTTGHGVGDVWYVVAP